MVSSSFSLTVKKIKLKKNTKAEEENPAGSEGQVPFIHVGSEGQVPCFHEGSPDKKNMSGGQLLQGLLPSAQKLGQ